MPDYKNIQAGILLPYERRFGCFVFLEFTGSPKKVASWIQEQIWSKISTTSDQMLERKDETTSNEKKILISFFLSGRGYQTLDSGHSEIYSVNDPLFKKGMNSYESRIATNDPPQTAGWAKEYQFKADALLYIAGDSSQIIQKQVEGLIASSIASKAVTPLHQQWGQTLYRNGHTIEPFGYRDNITNPTFFDHSQVTEEHFKIALDDYEGSYLVFRKLEQNVELFNQKILALSQQLNVTKAYAEALVMGRFKNGTPLHLSNLPLDYDQQPEAIKIALDAFDQGIIGYEGDRKGSKCPLHAHIRKANPRNERSHLLRKYKTSPPYTGQIVRRSIPYKDKSGEVGLLFLCFQRSLIHQYKVVQLDWLNKPFSIDPVAGHPNQPPKKEPSPNSWNRNWNQKTSPKVSFSFNHVIRFRGGEYFYAPSKKSLMELTDRPILGIRPKN